jgi:SAM-dependent methyltransferase
LNDNEIRHYYDLGLEAARLTTGTSPLEMIRTQNAILRRSIPFAAQILDIGGGPGLYAFWLASLGHHVHLIDVIPLHIEQAIEFSKQQRILLSSARVGDARNLDVPGSSMDAALLLGPLYHLTERAERLQALREVRRVLRPGGVLFAAAISRFASLLDGLFRRLVDDPRFIPILDRDLREGQHRNPTDQPDYFTTAFFHRPEELKTEIEEVGFVVEKMIGLEGPGWLLPDFEERWKDERFRNQLLNYLQLIEEEPSMIGISAHLLAVATRE